MNSPRVPDGSQCFFTGEVRALFAIDSAVFHAERAGDVYIAIIVPSSSRRT